MKRRSRLPTGDEMRLWAEIARTATPLPGKRLPVIAEEIAPPAENAPAVETAGVRAPAPGQKPPPVRLGSAGLGRREARALARGRAVPDGSIDLHGLSQAEAHAALIRFLRGSQAAGRSLVLVVTGKGRPAALPQTLTDRGVLRRMVPHWLALPDVRRVVIGWEEAGPRQGGAGALYVRLRRRPG